MPTLLAAGYTSFDLGIFTPKDPRFPILKSLLKRTYRRYLEEGIDYIVFRGQLGFDAWSLDVLEELRAEGFEFQMACVFCFQDQGKNWNEANQEVLARFKRLDYVAAAYESYENPGQLKAYQDLLLRHAQEVLFLYDEEHPTNLKYLKEAVQEKGIPLQMLDFYELNQEAENFSKDNG
ncbi:SLOG family protein [Streptococcus danieliae]|uniref:SLOG family protein n=1 Tax=Streptococcus danieliae TaxID=747656 RepID=UPI0026F10D4E|nr:SLOG family protein [Streptococcus danieliae]